MPVVIIGAGPAGLSAAYELTRRGCAPIVLERSAQVGGIARTETHGPYRFDVGGHRFFTKIPRISRLWDQLLGEDLLTVKRLSRIYYNGRFFRYPLSVRDTLTQLGLAESVRIVASYAAAKLKPHREEDTFEEWVSHRFGRRLYETFFKTYTEKVWGIPCSRITADWAAQRIKGLSLMAAVSHAFLKRGRARSLIEEFRYPRLGPGMMWERLQEAIEKRGGRVFLNTPVRQIFWESGKVRSVVCQSPEGPWEIQASEVVSTIPITTLTRLLNPAPPQDVLEAAGALRYRSFLMVALVLDTETLFQDQWIYVHDPHVKVGRVQNFKNWSREMVPVPGKTTVGMEYFCDEGDAWWSMDDEDLIRRAAGELERLQLAQRAWVSDGVVIRQPKAYPVYHQGYQEPLQRLRSFFETMTNLQTIGRNGMHRYNNMDHSMMTGLMAAENILGGRCDPWQVNAEAEYHEELSSRQLSREMQELLVAGILGKMDKTAVGVATGVVAGVGVAFATLWLVLKGGSVVGPHLALLSNYMPGYTVSWTGALLGGLYGMGYGFAAGWLFAGARNLAAAFRVYRLSRKEKKWKIKHFLDYL